MLDVPSLLRPRRPSLARAPSLRAGAAEKRLEEVGERILVAEQLVHLLFAHGPVAAARPPHVDRPGAFAGTAAAERAAAGPCLPLLLRLFVHPPVGAQLVVLPALVRVPEHFVRFVDFLEPGLRSL